MRRLGVVKAIDRANRVLRADIDGATDVECTYLAGDPQDPHCRMPWPLAEAYFDMNRGTPLCLGPIGERRVLFHDDFTYVSSPNGDTPWTLTLVTSPVGSAAVSAVTGAGLGVIRLAVTGGATSALGTLTKDSDALVIPSDGRALHVHLRVRTDAITVGVASDSALIGLISSTGSVAAAAVLSERAHGQVVARILNATDNIEGAEIEQDRWYDIDLLCDDNGGFCSVDGGDPAILTEPGPSAVPTTCHPIIAMTTVLNGATRHVDVDYFTVALVGVAPWGGS